MGKHNVKKHGVVSAIKGNKTSPKKVTIDSDEDSSSSSSSEEVGTSLQQTPVKMKQQTPVKMKQQTPVKMKQQTPIKIASTTKQPAQQLGVTTGRKRARDEESSSEEEDDSEEEEAPKLTKQTSPQKKQAVLQLSAKATTVGGKTSTDEDSSSEEDDDSEEEVTSEKGKQKPQQQKQLGHQVGTKAVGLKAQVEESSSEEEDSDEDDSEDAEEKSKSVKQISQQKKQVHQVSTKAAGQKAQVAESSSEEEDDSDEDDSEEDDSDEDDSKEEKEAPKSVKPVPQQKRQAAPKQAQVEDSEEEDSSEDEEEDSSEDEEEDSSEDEEEDKIPPGKRAQVTKSANGVKTMTKTSADDSDSDEEDEGSEEEEDSEDEEEEIVMVQGMQKRKGDEIKGQPATKKQKRKGDEADSNEDEADSNEDEADSNEDEAETVKVPESKKRKKKEVKKESTSKKPKREAANGSEGTITLYVGHLGKSTTEDEITNFFSKNSINVVEVRKPPNKTNAFVDLEDADDLQDALALNGSAFKNTTIAVEKAKPRAPAQAKQDQKTPSSTSPGNKSENEKDSRTLFVKNLPDNATSDGLKSFFDTAVDVRIPQRDGVHKGFGFIEFADKKTMEAAMSEHQGVEFNGNSLYLDYMGSRSSVKKQHTSPGGKQGRGGGRQVSSGSRGESKILFVKNLSYSTDESSLKAAFKGAVSARIPTFQDSGKSKGFAFVDFPTAEAAAKAFDSMSGQAIDGRQVTLDFAIDKSAGGGGGRGGFAPRGRGGNGGRGFRGGAAGGHRGRGGFGKAKGGLAQPQGKKIIFNKDSD